MKTVKAQCTKTNAKLVMQVSDDGKQILGFYKVSPKAFEEVPTQVRLDPNATVNFSCSKCGTRKFASCDCKFRSGACGVQALPGKDCLTCKYLEPSYKKAKTGGCIQLKAGECADLDLEQLKVGVNWDSYLDIDSSVILAEAQGGSHELIFFANKDSVDGSIHHRGDNLTGTKGAVAGAEDDEDIDIYLNKVKSNYSRIVFVINIYKGANSFKDVKGLKLTIYDQKTNEALISYDVQQNFSRYNSLVIGEARRTSSGWEFKAIGEGVNIDGVRALGSYCASKRW